MHKENDNCNIMSLETTYLPYNNEV